MNPVASLRLIDIPMPPLIDATYPSPGLMGKYILDLDVWSNTNEGMLQWLQNFLNQQGSITLDFVCAFQERTYRLVGCEAFDQNMGLKSRFDLFVGALSDRFESDPKRIKAGFMECVSLPDDKEEVCAAKARPYKVRAINESLTEIDF